LPQDYGKTPFDELTDDGKNIVKSFETEKIYTENLGKNLIEKKNQLMIEN